MATSTPNYSFSVPEDGGDDFTWGGFLNGNWTALDTLLAALQDQVDNLEATILGNLFPVGAYYISDDDNLPAPLLALGSWVRVQNRILKGTGGDAEAGLTGGSETATLSIGNLPAHTHGVNDVGHTHTVFDPGHDHLSPTGDEYAGFGTGGNNSPGPDGLRFDLRGKTSPATTGISVSGNITGISLGTTGSNVPFNIEQPWRKTNIWRRSS